MIRGLFSFICTCVFYLLQSQYSVSGTVYKTENQEVLPYIPLEIRSKNLNKKGISGKNGEYFLDNLPSGSYEITVKPDGEKKTEKIVIERTSVKKDIYFYSHKEQEKKVKNIGAIHLKKIKSIKSEIEKSGFAVSVIETKTASLRNLQTVELLDKTAGIRVRQNGGVGSNVLFNINGMSGNSITVLIDGIPISSYGSSFNINNIPPSIIERIEIYKGVVPGYLSDDSLGGAINIVLKKNIKNNLAFSLSYGSFNTLQADLMAAHRFKSGFTAKITNYYNRSDNNYKVWGKNVRNTLPNGQMKESVERRFNDRFNSRGSLLELGFTKVKWADVLLLGYTNTYFYKEIQHGLFMSRPYKGRFTEANANVLNLTYEKTNFLLKNLDFSFHALYSQRNRKINDTVTWAYNWNGQVIRDLQGNPVRSPYGAQQGNPTMTSIGRNINTIRTGLNYALTKNHRILFNLLYDHIDRKDRDELKLVAGKTYEAKREYQKNIAALSYEFKTIGNKFKTTLFGKYYYQKINRTEPSATTAGGSASLINESRSISMNNNGYGVAISYLASPAISLLASGERTVRLPTEKETFGDISENTLANFGIKPEKSNNYNLGITLGTYAFDLHRLGLSTGVFLRKTQDKIVRFASGQNLIISEALAFSNYGYTKSQGFEFSLNYSYNKNFRLSLNLSKFNSFFDIKGQSTYGMQIPNEPFFTLNTGSQYSFKDVFFQKSRLTVFYNYHFVEKFNSALLNYGSSGREYFEVPRQNIHDIGMSYQLPQKNIIISLDIKNLTNRQVYDNFGVQKPGRAFYVKLNYALN
ncbi:MAG: TonB-dependent receptor [Bergeyella sp.]|nr:TonB-dependent receptor [Bergeyella sp.]